MSHESVDSWESRIEQVAKYLGKTTKDIELMLSAEPFRITQDPNRLEMLSDEEITPFGDMRKIFCDENGVSLPQLRYCMKLLRGPKGSAKVTETDTNIIAFNARYGLETTVEDLDIDHLLEFYNPQKRSRIHDIIRSRYESKYGPVIAFRPNTSQVAIEDTLNYIADLESGLPTEESIEVDGELVRLYRVGEVPSERIDEDPLFPGVPLRRDRSTVNRVNWKDIPLETRQFFRILVEESFIDPNDRVELRKVIQLSLKELKETFPEAHLLFKERSVEGNLPKLNMSTKSVGSSRAQNPFAVKGNRVR